jgi:hypothetical protein
MDLMVLVLLCGGVLALVLGRDTRCRERLGRGKPFPVRILQHHVALLRGAELTAPGAAPRRILTRWSYEIGRCSCLMSVTESVVRETLKTHRRSKYG